MLGRIASMEINHKAVEKAKKGDTIALKIEATNADESAKLYGRHFDFKVSFHQQSRKPVFHNLNDCCPYLICTPALP